MEIAVWDMLTTYGRASFQIKKKKEKIGQNHSIQELECGNQPSLE